MVKIAGWSKTGKLSWRNLRDGMLFLNIRKNKWTDYNDYDVVLKKQGAVYEIKTKFDTLEKSKDFAYKWMKKHPDYRWYPYGISGKVRKK